MAHARTSTGAIVCVSTDDRDEVDFLADAAIAAGGTVASDPMDHGSMCGRSFHDLGGHLWEVICLGPEAVEQGPADMAQTA